MVWNYKSLQPSNYSSDVQAELVAIEEAMNYLA